ncbi:hypothetical protein AC579_9941 [Pseudocercospora musae]|uniref:2EXR domain-containing protein n=1 Tax=Pseudocercospora musae TaxID=113226 RepID=A0A139H009_9PEZI|nr:hypothetical protein AC579_9941 [Pseudocercospora musae]
MAEELVESISNIEPDSKDQTTAIPPKPEEQQQQLKPFPFLSLPPEVRNRIYEWCLCPTQILSLTRTKSSRFATTPTITPQLLRTNKKIYNECGQNHSYLFENEICLSLDAHDTSWPVISETRLPQHVLERLEKVCMVFDVTETFRASYREDVDFTALTALTNLTNLRLGVVFDESSGYPEEFWGELTCHVDGLDLRAP